MLQLQEIRLTKFYIFLIFVNNIFLQERIIVNTANSPAMFTLPKLCNTLPIYIKRIQQMKNPLSVIQTAHKIGKVVSRICFFVSIVVAAVLLVTLISLLFGLDKIPAMADLLADWEYSKETLYGLSLVGIIYSLGEALICRKAYGYFSLELERGTPFTYEGAKMLLRVGIMNIAISVVAFALSSIVYHLMALTLGNMSPLKLNSTGSLTLGIMFVITSYMLSYGADLEKENNTKE